MLDHNLPAKLFPVILSIAAPSCHFNHVTIEMELQLNVSSRNLAHRENDVA